MPAFPRSDSVHLPPTNTDTEAKLRRIYHGLTKVVESLPQRKRWSNLTMEETKTLQELRKKPVALMPSDKGGEFCAVKLEEYKEMARAHLADTSTYQLVPRMTAKTVEGKVNQAWKAVCRAREIPKRCERSFVSSSTRLATFHHVIKTHKPGPQLKIRPIVASRGSPTEKITWLLSTILSPMLSKIPTHMPNSEHLMAILNNAAPRILTRHQFQCSLDVEALYTSVPVNEALLAVRDKLGQDVPAPLQQEDVIQLLHTVFGLTYFTNEGRIYRQVAGLPMGNAASGIVAIIFMEKIEKRALTLFARCPIFLRYVDDCYALVRSPEESRELQACLNEQHPAINFELEECTSSGGTTSLSLLDLNIRINDTGEVAFNFYTKEAKSSIFMHKESALPWQQKAAAIQNETKRIEARSEGEDRTRNEAAFEAKLRENGYNESDIQLLKSTSRRRRLNRVCQGPVHYIDLPYVGEKAERRFRRVFKQEGVNIRIYRKSRTLLDIVRPRQPESRRCTWPTCPTREKALCYRKNCVYDIKCSPCGCHYIGSTTRPLHERIREHTTKGRGSTIHEHLIRCGGGTAQVEVRILAQEKDEVNTRLREAIIIKKQRPELNTREESDLVNIIF